jgi:phage antirepressor YoqD-like protein
MDENKNTAVQSAMQIFSYEGSNVTFSKGENVLVNANDMAAAFGKLPKDFLKNKRTKEFLETLSSRRKILLTDLVQVKNGGDNPGTWMHEDVAIEFARWLSPDFAIWTNDRIKELMREGVATVSDDDDIIAHAMEVLQRRLEAKQQQLQMAESTIEAQNLQLQQQNNQIQSLTPMADYTRDVLQSTSTYTLTEVAKDLGMRSVSVLTDFCRQHRVLYRQSDRWLPTANYAANGFFQTRTAKYFHSDGTIGTSLSTVVTEKGRVMLRKLMEKKGGVL